MTKIIEEGKGQLEKVLGESGGKAKEIIAQIQTGLDEIVEKHGELTLKWEEQLQSLEVGEKLQSLLEELKDAQSKLVDNIAAAVREALDKLVTSIPEVEEEAPAPVAKVAPARKRIASKSSAKPAARKAAKPAAKKKTARKAS